MAGLEGVVDEAKFYVMLKHFNLLTVQKLCLIACCGGLEALDRQGQVVGNPSVLRRLCEYLGTQGCTPKMAGWKSFVTVVNEAMFKTSAEDTKPFELGSYSKARKSGALVDPEEHRGRKAIDGPRSAKILASNPLSENTTKTKVFYTYQDGATRVAYQDWTDKPL
jgi:hypothetical protein